MYGQISEFTLYMMFYSGVTVLNLMACCYLLFRRNNAFSTDITSPLRLRRWTAALFAAMTLSHLWYLPPNFAESSDDARLYILIAGLLDSMTIFPLAIAVLFVMLQDRRRPLWPVAVMVSPLTAGLALSVASCSFDFFPILYAYLILLGVGLIIYMVYALRQYGRWLRDNYADLEHKEVWQSFTVFGFFMLVFCIYAISSKVAGYEYALQFACILLNCYLVWRVETLSDLSLQEAPTAEVASTDSQTPKPQKPVDDIGPLLQRHCIDAHLYLQHDLTLEQLAHAIGTNRFYLSQYFSSQGKTYNAYINDLRINHFVSLHRKTVATLRPFTAQQLAHESGYRSYSTFSLAFKQRMGQTVTAWMRNNAR